MKQKQYGPSPEVKLIVPKFFSFERRLFRLLAQMRL